MAYSHLRIAVALTLVFVLFSMFVFSVFATGYSFGVAPGDYVVLSNVDSINISSEGIVNWEKIEVVSVTGAEIVWRLTGQMQDGSAFLDNGNTFFSNIETGVTNYTHSDLGPIIAANLNAGDKIMTASIPYEVNTTEVLNYLNVSRTVNVVVSEVSGVGVGVNGRPYVANFTYVYDRASGILLENVVRFDWNWATNNSTEQLDTFSVTGTNIFSAALPPYQVPVAILYVVAAVVVIVLVSVPTVMFRRRQNSARKVELEKTEETDLIYNSAGVNRGECYLSESLERCMKVACELHSHGVRGLAIVREDPEFLVKSCHLEPENVILLSIKPIKGFKAINNIQEISIAMMKFVKAGGGFVLLDGLEYLISRFGFSTVYMMLQEKKIEFLEAGAVLLVPLNMESLNSQEKGQLLGELKLL